MGRRILAVVLAIAGFAAPASAQAPLRKIGELDLRILGVSAACEPASPVVPKNTASAVRIVVRSGGTELSSADVAGLFGAGFEVGAELSGPGLAATITLPHLEPGDALPADPMLLPIPALPAAGDYTLANLRIVSGGRPVLDVAPSSVAVKVIDQILVTSVKTRPLTLDELRDRGVDLSSPDNYLGFAFTLGLKLESNVVSFTMPVVFDRQGRVVPEPINPPAAPPRSSGVLASMPTFVPMLLDAEADGDTGAPPPSLLLPQGGGPVRIPSVLVIPGNVGYLKQFFSAQLFVANGAPPGSGLVVRDVTGRIQLPLGPDGIRGSDPTSGANDDPLSLPNLVRDGESVIQSEQLPVRGLGLDGVAGTADDTDVFRPAEQGMAEFTIRGDREGFHTIDFDVRAVLEGLPVGPVRLKGHASGGVLVRNPYFSMTFTAPSVVRADEAFSLFATITNVGQSPANLLTVNLDDAALSGLELAPGETGSRTIDTLAPGNAAGFEFHFTSRRTGQVVASYLRFDAQGGAAVQGDLRFTVGVGERGVALSPDTLSLPAAVDGLPHDVVQAAMRVLGQAWSVANAPAGTLPASVIRTTRDVVTQKALALAEAGLRVRLGQEPAAAVRDLLYDFWSGNPLPDPGFDQLLRTTEAGRGLAAAIGSALADSAATAGGAADYERELARLLASGPGALTFSLAGPRSDVSLRDSEHVLTFAGGRMTSAELPGAVVTVLASSSVGPVLGLLSAPASPSYQLDLYPQESGSFDLSVTIPRGDGSVLRGTLRAASLTAGEHARVELDLQRGRLLSLDRDLDRDGVVDASIPFDVDWGAAAAEGPRLVAARLIGPETLSSASPFGTSLALLFDRVVDAAGAAVLSHYVVPQNNVESARRQLSGRIVFATLARPEGNALPSRISLDGLTDTRGRFGPPASDEPILSLVTDPGAVVSGRVLNGDGSPLAGTVLVTYTNDPATVCGLGSSPTAVSQLPVDERGGFELRYVRRSPCGAPFELVTQDPVTGAARKVTRYVRSDGERIVVDIVLLARGSVTGTVRRFRGVGSTDTEPAAGANVAVVSSSDPQSGGSTVTDGDGRYRVDGITVGAVAVRAAGGSGIGSGVGRIDRPGTPAVVDVLLDERAASVHGTVYTVDANVTDPAQRTRPLAGVQLVYRVDGQVLAVAQSDEAGRYRIEAIPVGGFTVSAALNQRDQGSTQGQASVGQDVTADVFIAIPLEATLGTLRGVVVDAAGDPAAEVYVSVGDLAALTSTDGSYEIRGIPASGIRTVSARTRDGKRTATRTFEFPAQPAPVVAVDLQLSGLGAVRVVVRDPAGRQLHGQQVLLQGVCANPCGCRGAATGASDDQGAIFGELPIGTYQFRAFLPAAGYTDVAATTVTVREGETLGLIQFRGAGRVSGVVLDPPQVGGRPSNGADVILSSRVFVNDGQQVCDLVPGSSHRIRTGLDGTFAFTGVTVGSFTVTAHSEFLDKDASARGTVTRDADAVGPLTLQLVDTMAGVLSGHVYLPDGTTPSGAGVQVTVNGALPDVTVKTGIDGAYRFAPILPQGNWTLTALDPETGLTTRTQIALRQGEDARHDLRLRGRGSVRVHVVDGAGQPVPEALVHLAENEYPARQFDGVVSTSGGGVVAFDTVTEGGFVVTASDPLGRGGRTGSTLPGPAQAVDVTVRMTTTGTVAGHFRLPGSGSPVTLGSVTLTSNGRVVGQATTDGADPGAFSFSYVPAGEIRVEAIDPLTGRTGFNVGTLQNEGQQLVLDITAQALGSVGGLVTLNGVGEPRARIDLVSGSFRVSTFAGADGVYQIDGVPEGHVVVTAARSGGGLSGTAAGSLTTEGQALAIDVALRDTGRVEGNVRSAGGGVAPLAIVTVQVGGVGGATLSTTTGLEDGYYVLEQVPAGLATFSVDVPGSIDRARGTGEVPARGSTRVDLELVGSGSIAGTVHGLPAGYTAEVRAVGSGAFPYQLITKPDAVGRFFIPEALAGPVTLFLRATGALGLSGGSATGAVTPRQTANFDLSLQPTGRVLGTIRRADGRPAFGADVTLVSVAGQLVTQAGADGSFALDVVPAGAVTVAVGDRLTGGFGRAAGLVPDGLDLVLEPIQLDDTPVVVTGVDPADGAAGIALDQPVRVQLSDPVADGYYGSVFVSDGARQVSVAATRSADAMTLTITPPYGGWPDGRELTVSATTALTDVFGRHVAAPFTSHFRTVDVSAPAVVGKLPPDAAIQVPAGAVVTVTFDEGLSSTADTSALVSLARGAVAVGGLVTLSPDRRVATFTPAEPLVANDRYTASVSGAVDESGNRQKSPVSWTFVTTDTIPPTLVGLTPAANAWTSNPRPPIQLQLADLQPGSGIDPATANAELALDGTPVPFTINAGAIAATPAADLLDGSHVITAAASDRAGNRGNLAPVTFGVDRTPPSAPLLTSPAGHQTLRGVATISATASDATSGLATVRVHLDGSASPFLTLGPPGFTSSWSTAGVVEGAHTLTAVAVDGAGNVSAVGAPVDVIVDNQPLTLVVLAPAPGTRVRDQVTVRARSSESVARLDISLGSRTQSGQLVSDRTYEATLDLASVAEGEQAVVVTAVGLLGESVSASVGVVIDRTPPAAPVATLITAEESDAGYALVQGLPGAVESRATVEVTNPATAVHTTSAAALDGSFAARLIAALDAPVELVAVDAVGNRSAATTVTVQRRSVEGGVPLQGLATWVSADQGVTTDSSGRVQSWADRSQVTTPNNLGQSNAAARPLLVADGFNGWPVLRFDGADDALVFARRVTTTGTVFWVVKESASAGTAARSLLGDGAYAAFAGGGGTAATASTPEVPGAIWYPGYAAADVYNGQTWVNGQLVDGRSTPRPREMSVVSWLSARDQSTLYADRFGTAAYTSPWQGDLAELIVYERLLTPGERQSVEDYLVRKYRPYVPAAGTPAFSPAGGAFSGSTTVQLSTSTPGAEIRYTLDGSEPTSVSALYDNALLLDHSATLKARSFASGYLDSATATASFVRREDSPVLAATGLALWLRADAGLATNAGGWVTSWGDQSGTLNDAYQTNGAAAPALVANAVNGLPVLRFDGSNDTLRFTRRLTTVGTAFWVVKESSSAGTLSRSLLGDGSYATFAGGAGQAATQTTAEVAGALWYGGYASADVVNGRTQVNGLPVDGKTTPRPRQMSVVSWVSARDQSALYADRFGEALYTSPWQGDLAELIVYDRTLSAAEVKQIEDYLRAKYALGGVPTVSVEPAGGVFDASQTVRLASPAAGAEIRYTLDGTEPTVSSALYTDPLELQATTTVKTKAYAAWGESATVTASFTRRQDAVPLLVDETHLQLWWRADAGVASGTGGFWADQSGKANHGYQPSGAKVPVLVANAVNALPAMRFDGTADSVLFTRRLTTVGTAFWVVKESSSAGTLSRSLLGDGSYATFAGGAGQAATQTTAEVAGALWYGGYASADVVNGRTQVNGLPVDGKTTPRPRQMSVVSWVSARDQSALYADRFGEALYTSPWQGDLAELIVYDRTLSAAEVKQIEDYLNARYRLFVR